MKTKLHYSILLAIVIFMFGCQKDFLDKKPNKALLVPTTLSDFQSLLDNLSVMNTVPGIERIATDDLYTNDDGWQYWSTADQRNSYIWAKDIYEGAPSLDWNSPYQQVFYANIVLDGLDKMNENQVPQNDYNRVKGSALFYRAVAYYHLAQLFAKQYNSSTAKQDLGIPIRLSSDVNLRPGRGTVQDVYDRILNDFDASVQLLPQVATLKSRPSKVAALAFLSRVYLTMGNYQKTYDLASQALALNNKLIDYNTLDTTSASPFPVDLPNSNDEVLFHSVSLAYDFAYSSETGVDTTVLRSYAPNDLRKPLIFYWASAPFVSFNDSYSGPAGFFAGIANDEVYLNEAEALARLNRIPEAMTALNDLLVKRFIKGSYIAYSASNTSDALKIILSERRKELFTNQGMLRWVDLRRLNLDPQFAVTLKHIIGGKVYTLPPNDNRYVYPIPDNEIQNDNIQQNPR
ncbi:MAG TPA: RagB/SusD family nutrient uptake outer membrane protein [Candidatus Babeliaceae bacterium]|nr:RagB/SusD family nutrient uptake outer membrane protein [Candidatus Babeliaceae bacterium]